MDPDPGFYIVVVVAYHVTMIAIGRAVCPRSSDPFYIVSYYKKWAISFWTYST